MLLRESVEYFHWSQQRLALAKPSIYTLDFTRPDEQVYRFNNRHMNDLERFDLAVRGLVGKRLTFDELIGKNLEEQVS